MKILASITSVAAAGLMITSASADEVSDTLQSALTAYEEGDITYAIEELDYAKQLMAELQTGALSAFLPPAPDGWTAEDDPDTVAGFAMMGGGTAASKRYYSDSGSFNINIVVDSPMIAMMGGMIQNAGSMGMKTVRVGREKFMDNDGEMSALIDGRVLVQATGEPRETIIAVLEQIDYRELGRFGY